MRVCHGESGYVELTIAVWEKFGAVKTALREYQQQDIFNMDETCLFFKLQPNKTLADAVVAGEKKDKDRITVGLTTNMDGSVKLPPLIIHKSLKPRAFMQRSLRNPDNLGIYWHSNKKAWMTGDVFKKFLLRFDQMMVERGRQKVALLVDNARVHLCSELTLKFTTVLFLPPLTTSRFQPMEAGIIKSFKSQYQKLFLQRQIDDFENLLVTKLDIYDAVLMIEKAWTEFVTQRTIINCWTHTGLVLTTETTSSGIPRDLDLNLEAENDDCDLVLQLKDVTCLLEDLCLQYHVTMSIEKYVEIYGSNNTPTFELDDVLEPTLDTVVTEAHEEDESSLQVDPISYKVMTRALQLVSVYLQQLHADTIPLQAKVKDIEKWCHKDYDTNLEQTIVDMFYSRVSSPSYLG